MDKSCEDLKGFFVDGVPIVSTSDMSEEERLLSEEQAKLYQPNNQTIIDLDKLVDSIYPINPNLFLTEAISFLQSKGVVLSKDLPIIIKELCIAFNDCISSQNKPIMTTSLVYPAQTGTGKSLSLQVYVSMLKEHSSLIVVSTVDAAIAYCETINQLSGDDKYARTTYALTEIHKQNALRVESYALKNYRAIIITHSMFKKLNQKVDVDTYKLYKGKQRDLVVIDEKLSMYEQYKVTYNDLDILKNNLETIFFKVEDAAKLDPTQATITFLSTLKTYLEKCEDEIITDPKALRFIRNDISNEELKTIDIKDPRFIKGSCPIATIPNNKIHDLMQEQNLDIKSTITLMKQLFEARINQLFSEIKDLGGLDNPAYKEQTLKNSLAPINILEEVLNEWFLLYKSNYEKAIFRVDDISHKLGKNVVLDATATVNEFYKIANRAFGYVGMYNAKQIRKYENLTIHKAKGYKQTRYELYKKEDKYTAKNAEIYASYAISVLTDMDDRLLIICHKNFKPILKTKLDDPRIKMTHWGDHVGKNDWSDCNKIMVIGWNYLSPLKNISDIFNAASAQEIDLVSLYLNDDIIDTFIATQIADDLIQAVMRSKARIIATNDSDCNPTEVYLFYHDDPMSNRILDIFEKQFPMVKIQQWEPIGISLSHKKTKPMLNADKVIELLKAKEATQTTCLLSDVIEQTLIPKATMSRITTDDYFLQKLQEHGYSLQNKNGKEKYFVLQ
ncbi:hypothetical protein SUSP_002593 [Sulfurospirillum sp. 'SP']|nr:hypothetical protein [Sulfurospirillum sp. 'SP']WNZ00176.1 hypothetical protein SUSP_002593 [Sulfurospirillum sp. 'SP']